MAGDIGFDFRTKTKRWIYKTPEAVNSQGKWAKINLHHVDQSSEAGGVVAEILQTENGSKLLHPGKQDKIDDALWDAFRENHWEIDCKRP